VSLFSKHATLVDVDRPDSLLARMQSALNKVDVVVTSGGVSMGEKVIRSATFCMCCWYKMLLSLLLFGCSCCYHL